MDPLVGQALVNAGSQVVGSALSGKGNSRASKTQAQTADKALAYEREKDAEEKAYRDKVDAEARARFMAEEAMRAPYRQASNGLLASEMARLGFSLPSSGGSAPPLIASKPKTLGDLAGLGTRISEPLDTETEDPYNTRYSSTTEDQGMRRLNMPKIRLSDLMGSDQTNAHARGGTIGDVARWSR